MSDGEKDYSKAKDGYGWCIGVAKKIKELGSNNPSLQHITSELSEEAGKMCKNYDNWVERESEYRLKEYKNILWAKIVNDLQEFQEAYTMEDSVALCGFMKRRTAGMIKALEASGITEAQRVVG